MPVELRKRKAREEPVVAPAPPKKTKKAAAPAKKGKKAEAKPAKETAGTEEKKQDSDAAETKPAAAAASGKVTVGEKISLDGFGGEIETHDGEKLTLKELVEKSEKGVVLFTYPKASTPGCTTQACLFRDNFTDVTATGLAIYGLSADSPKSNTSFKTNKQLPYPLLCDKDRTLIHAIGLKKGPSGTQRGVFVVNKEGEVLVAEPGGPAATVEKVKELVKTQK